MLQGDPAEDVPWSVGQAGQHPLSRGFGTEEQELAVSTFRRRYPEVLLSSYDEICSV